MTKYVLACTLAMVCLRGQSEAPVTFGTTVVIPSGLRGDVYFIRKGTTVLPDFEGLKEVGTIWTTKLNVPPRHWRDGFPGLTKRHEWFAINYTGRFWIAKPGPYRFSLLSDDGSMLFIDDQKVVDNDCLHPPDVRGAAIELSGGIHRIRVSYFQGPRDCLALVLAVAGPDEEWHIFSTDEFKPPTNPEEWAYGGVSELSAAPVQDAKRHKLDDIVGKHPEKLKEEQGGDARAPRSPGWGCTVYPPIHYCGK